MTPRARDGDDDLWWRQRMEAYVKNEGLWDDHDICRIMNNDPDLKDFRLGHEGEESFSGAVWELLGSCIADNDHLEAICLSTTGHNFIDSDMSMLFRGLTRGATLKEFTLSGNGFGLSGIRSMVPFLHYTWSLTNLTIIGSSNIDAECLRVVVDALRGYPIETLSFSACNLDDLSALEIECPPWIPDVDCCKLPHLHTLDLDRNNIHNISSLEHYLHLRELYLEGNPIGRDGCMVISKLLKGDSSLMVLGLNSTGMGDDEAKIFANSLQHNSTLTDLSLLDNEIKGRGLKAFMKLLNDISSIGRTYNSNHYLTSLGLPYSTNQQIREMKQHINASCKINDQQGREPATVGRAKVIETQLNSKKRMDLSRLQGVGYCYSRIFAEIDPAVMPHVYALSSRHGQNEMFCMLLAMPDLVSNSNKQTFPEQKPLNVLWVIPGRAACAKKQYFPHRKPPENSRLQVVAAGEKSKRRHCRQHIGHRRNHLVWG